MIDLANEFSHSWVPTATIWYLWGNSSFVKHSGDSLACWFQVTTLIKISPDVSSWDCIFLWLDGSPSPILEDADASQRGLGQDLFLFKNGLGIDWLLEGTTMKAISRWRVRVPHILLVLRWVRCVPALRRVIWFEFIKLFNLWTLPALQELVLFFFLSFLSRILIGIQAFDQWIR